MVARRRNQRRQQPPKVEHSGTTGTSSSEHTTSRTRRRLRDGTKPKVTQLFVLLLSHVSRPTLQACAILVVAIVAAVVWNWLDGNAVDPLVQNFLDLTCRHSDVFCHTGLTASRRTQKATRSIETGATVLEIPRRFQIWDLDALRSSFVRDQLLRARIHLEEQHENGIPLPSAAFLAAHISLLQVSNVTDIDPLLAYYLKNVLPAYEDYLDFHPILWQGEYIADVLGMYTLSYIHVMAFRRLLGDEYAAFSAASPMFAERVSREAYLAARLNVMTRSFGTGELDQFHHEAMSSIPWVEELDYYRQTAGVDLDHGSHAMVPILDVYDHHAKPNVDFSYDVHKRAFVVSAVTKIAAGYEIMDSYGKRTDSDLFARYGFVNGDGSGWTQASLALWHTVDVQPENVVQSNRLLPNEVMRVLRYLQYDDGYENCITPTSHNQEDFETAAWEFKKLKLEYLLSIATVESRWVFRMSPRDKLSTPSVSSDHPITLEPPPPFDMRSLQFDGNAVFGTCRLLVLTHVDYGGNNATAMLRQALLEKSTESTTKKKAQFVLPPTQDGLEYRTQLCIARMASTALNRFGVSVEDQRALVSRLNREAFGSHNWTAAHLRLGEMQSLEMLKQVAFTGLHRLFGPDALSLKSTDPAYSMRDKPCPPKYLRPLVEALSSV